MKKVMKVLVLVAVMLLTLSFAYCADTSIGTEFPTGGTEIDSVTGAAKNVWSTVITIVQILAFAAIIFAGLRYMFASADAKGAIKGQTVGLVVGAILVFASPVVVEFVSGLASSVLE